MPIYEYHCKPCNARFEKLTTISRADEQTCPTCGSGRVSRLVSTFASRVSGSDSHSGGSCAGCASGQCGSCGHSH